MSRGSKFLSLVIHNDAIKEDPPQIYGWRVFFLACSACFGGMIFGMDIGAIGGILQFKTFQVDFHTDHLSKTAQANLNQNITSTLQAGCFVGALAAAWVADKLGRKAGLMIASLITLIGIIFQASALGHIAVMYIGRFIAGLGVGAASMVTPLYVSECAPRAIRGGLTGIYQFFIVTGVMLAYWINYGSSRHQHGKAQYAVPLAMQGLPSIMLIISMFFCHETPRHLAKTDRWEDASRVLVEIRQLPADHPYVQGELNDMATQLEHERMLIGGATFWDLQREMWTIPGNRNRALISIGLMVCQQMTGTNAINYYAPQIFNALGVTGTNTQLFATGIYGIVKMVACAVFLLLAADSLGRRRSLLWTSIAQGCSMFYIGIYMRVSPPVPGNVTPAGYFSLVCVFLFAAFFQFGWGPVCWIYVSEIPSARLRSLNVALAAATQWLFNFVVARGTLSMMATMGHVHKEVNGKVGDGTGYGTFFLYGSFCFTMFFFVWFLIPETKGMSLEKMDDLFGVTELAKTIDTESQHRDTKGPEKTITENA